MIELREYQNEAVDSTWDLLQKRRNPILAAPTGSGKTVMGTNIVAKKVFDSARTLTNGRVLWLAHRKELINQAYDTMSKACIGGVGVIMSGDPRERPNAMIVVASIQTLIKRTLPDVDLVVVDEAHHARGAMYSKILSHYQKKGVPCLGLTATPFRLDGKGLGAHFSDIVVASTTADLCIEGYLTEPIVYAPMSPDMKGVKVRGGDFALNITSEIMRDPVMIKGAVDAWEKLAKNRKTVVNAVDVAHSLAVTKEFKKRGYAFAHLDSHTSDEERKQILEDLADGDLVGVVNCMILSEGWDLPSLEVCVSLRPTASLCLHLQQIGRIMRAADDKIGAMVIDCSGNHRRHGFVTQKYIFSLNDMVRPSNPAMGVSPTKECPGCKMVLASKVAECPDCGHVFTMAPALLPGRATGGGSFSRLEPIDPKELAKMCRFWGKLDKQAENWGRKPMWKTKRFEENFGCEPMVVDGQVLDPLMASEQQKAKFYVGLLEAGESAGYKLGAAFYRYQAAVGGKPNFKWAPERFQKQMLKMWRKKR